MLFYSRCLQNFRSIVLTFFSFLTSDCHMKSYRRQWTEKNVPGDVYVSRSYAKKVFCPWFSLETVKNIMPSLQIGAPNLFKRKKKIEECVEHLLSWNDFCVSLRSSFSSKPKWSRKSFKTRKNNTNFVTHHINMTNQVYDQSIDVWMMPTLWIAHEPLKTYVSAGWRFVRKDKRYT